VTQVISSRSDDEAAAKRIAEALSPAAIDALLKDAENSGTPLDGADGLLNQVTKAVLKRALQVEMTDHVGYEVGDSAGGEPVIPVMGRRRRRWQRRLGRSRLACRGTGMGRSSRGLCRSVPVGWAISTR
jgi:hypothetical protein